MYVALRYAVQSLRHTLRKLEEQAERLDIRGLEIRESAAACFFAAPFYSLFFMTEIGIKICL
jgi:hypothetical protein